MAKKYHHVVRKIEDESGRLLMACQAFKILADVHRNDPEALRLIIRSLEHLEVAVRRHAEIRQDVENPVVIEFVDSFYKSIGPPYPD